MASHLQRDIDRVHSDLLALSGAVEDMIDKAALAISELEYGLATEVIEADQTVDQREVQIEEECLRILALRQPVATDLRRITAILKANNDLEQIADLAVNIAERAQHLCGRDEFPASAAFEAMVSEARSMVRQALDAFVQGDAAAAREVCARDDVVDQLNRDFIAELLRYVSARTHLVGDALHHFSASRHVEQIADHATNIAEDVIYMVEGQIVRHRHRAPT